jgi:type IV pilus assembly protein PilC
MPQFHYRAMRADGTTIESAIAGESVAVVRSQLESQGLLICRLDGATQTGIAATQSWFGGKQLALREFLVFNQEFLALMKAGLPILKTFDLLAERATHPQFQAALQGVRTEVRGGSSISEAMARYPLHFSELYRATLQSGEQTGALVDVLQRYLEYIKLVIAVREKVVKAMAYPAFLIIVGLAVVAFLLIYVMPTFADIYSQSKTELPIPTKILLHVVGTSRDWAPWVLTGTALTAWGLHRWSRTSGGRAQSDRLSLYLPILGEVFLKNQLIRLTRTLSTILGGGIPLLHALEITRGAVTNRIVSGAIERATARVRDGVGLAAALKQERLFPQMMLEMIEVGETTGSLEAMLRDVAEFQEGELDLRLNQLTTWMEPVLLLVMGILVGGLVIVMYLPIFQMAGTV